MFSPYCVEFGSILCVWRSSSMYFLWIGFFCVWLQALFFEFHVFYSTLNLRCCSLRTSYWLFCTAIGIFGAVVMKENLHIRLTTILFVTQLICWWLRIEIYWMFYGTISCVWTGQDGFNKWNNFQTKCLLNHFEVSRALIFLFVNCRLVLTIQATLKYLQRRVNGNWYLFLLAFIWRITQVVGSVCWFACLLLEWSGILHCVFCITTAIGGLAAKFVEQYIMWIWPGMFTWMQQAFLAISKIQSANRNSKQMTALFKEYLDSECTTNTYRFCTFNSETFEVFICKT